jgi:hypothetical protein
MNKQEKTMTIITHENTTPVTLDATSNTTTIKIPIPPPIMTCLMEMPRSLQILFIMSLIPIVGIIDIYRNLTPQITGRHRSVGKNEPAVWRPVHLLVIP